ncbi:MAG: sugar phosphate nucleotidyltransferase [Actinomycetota bacterium]|nr:sugar phosphate nucleotidyltransferase [Actinomycetota bacterium]
MRAVIMAGGRGTRLAPYTTVLPKPLMPLGDRPILDVLIRQLVRAGVERVTISVGHLGGILEAWVRHEEDYGVPVDFLYESEPLGTAGALGSMKDPGETFLAMNGDILTTLDYGALVNFHREQGSAATMAVRERSVRVDYGVVHADGGHRVIGLEEKPSLTYTVSMGVYAFDGSVIDEIPRGRHLDFPELLMRLVAEGRTVCAYPFAGYWRDIGNHDDYEQAIIDFEQAPGDFLDPVLSAEPRWTPPS